MNKACETRSLVVRVLLLSVLLGVGQIYFAFTLKYFIKDGSVVQSVVKNQTVAISEYTVIPRLYKNDSFGACLMIKEDNDLLYEWLAYHYTILPLRYILVGSDRNNQQNPRDVLERWESARTGLHFWIVNASDFAPESMDHHGKLKIDGDDDERMDAHHAFANRQRGFISYCTEFMKKQGLGWVTLIDSDEFVVINRLSEDNPAEGIAPIHLKLRQAIPELETNATVLDIIRRLNQIKTLSPCCTMPRLLHGALENVTCGRQAESTNQLARENGFRHEELSTLRFTQHSKKGDFATSKWGKVMFDLSNLTHETLGRSPRNVHRPFKPECGPGVVHFPEAVFYLNHYIGSWDRYNSRNDSRRNRNEWEKRAFITTASSCDKAIYSWFPRFVDTVGLHRAKFLLGSDFPS